MCRDLERCAQKADHLLDWVLVLDLFRDHAHPSHFRCGQERKPVRPKNNLVDDRRFMDIRRTDTLEVAHKQTGCQFCFTICSHVRLQDGAVPLDTTWPDFQHVALRIPEDQCIMNCRNPFLIETLHIVPELVGQHHEIIKSFP